jgi:hypothetical protein
VFTRKTPAQLAAAGDPVRRHELRQMSKKNGEHASTIAKDYIKLATASHESANSVEQCLENYLRAIVMETTHDMDGDRKFEKQMKAYARGK